MRRLIVLLFVLPFITASAALAHETFDHTATAHYIANEGVLVTQGETKIMFDPLPLSGLGTYMELSKTQKQQMMQGVPPYDGIDAIFISHAHRDHFSAKNMIAYMIAHPQTHLIAPEQAIAMMRADDAWTSEIIPRLTSVNLSFMEAPQTIEIGDVSATAVYIPHAGWPNPERAKVQNMVFRVTLDAGATVTHMGDADVRHQHFTHFDTHWNAKRTNMAFPPYWFFLSPEGENILNTIMNIETAVGTHVPLVVPQDLKTSGADYFSERGETRTIYRQNKTQ